jgi:hypothetical protein
MKKYVSPFVKRMNAIKARIVYKMLWNSSKNGTYIKAKHGNLK